MDITESFSRFARYITEQSGKAGAFVFAFVLILCWFMSGPFFGFSETWQLVINTTTTIITFLMVFLIQHSQNNDTDAIHKKLDEIIYSIDKADDKIAGIEKDKR
jgi:low affinity Fe/Cu permease